MLEELEVRNTRVEDASSISALVLKVAPSFASAPGALVAPWFAETITSAAIAGYVGDSRFNYLIALVKSVLAGVIAVCEETHVHHLFVAPEYQRQGIAAQLWQRAKSGALAVGNSDGFYVRSSKDAVPVYESFVSVLRAREWRKMGLFLSPCTWRLAVCIVTSRCSRCP